MGDADDVVARAHDLERRLDGTTVIDDLLGYARQNRRTSRIALAGNVILAVVVVVLAVTVVNVRHNTDNVRRNSADLVHVQDVAVAVAETLRATCEADNRDKAIEDQIWRLIFAQPPAANQTPEQRELAEQVEALTLRAYAADDCNVEAP